MSETIWNGHSRALAIEVGQSLSVVAVTGSYTLLTTAGAGTGTALATNATGGTYGPYATAITVRLVSSALSEVDFDVAVTPVIVSDTLVKAATNPLTGGIVGLSDPASGQTRSIVRRGTASVQKPFSYAGQSVSLGTTLVTQHAADDSFYAVQLFYGNWSGSTYDVTTARVSPTPTHQDLGSTTTWTNVTFPTATCPAGSGSGNDIVPGMIASNVIPVISAARTDDTTKKPLLQCRTYFAAAASAGQVGGTDLSNFNASAAANGYQYASRAPTGDATATFTAAQNPLEAGTWVAPMAVKFFYNVRTVMLASVGDSLTKGHLSTSNALGWPIRAAAALSNAALRVTDGNFAWTGQTHAASMAIAKQVISIVKPDVLTFCAWSPNDAAAGSQTQAIFDAGWGRTLEIVELCRQNNVIPVVVTSGAWNSLSAAENSRRLAQNARVRTLGSLAVVIDAASVLDNPANNNQILPAYDNGDGLHYNDVGYAAIAAVAATALKAAI